MISPNISLLNAQQSKKKKKNTFPIMAIFSSSSLLEFKKLQKIYHFLFPSPDLVPVAINKCHPGGKQFSAVTSRISAEVWQPEKSTNSSKVSLFKRNEYFRFKVDMNFFESCISVTTKHLADQCYRKNMHLIHHLSYFFKLYETNKKNLYY